MTRVSWKQTRVEKRNSWHFFDTKKKINGTITKRFLNFHVSSKIHCIVKYRTEVLHAESFYLYSVIFSMMIYPIVTAIITQSITVVIVWGKYTYFYEVTSIVHVPGLFPVIVSIAAICGNQALLSSLVKLILKFYNYFKIPISSRLFQALR